MATTTNIRQKANRMADKALNSAEDGVENLRSAKNRANSRAASHDGQFEHLAEEAGQHLRDTYDAGMEQLKYGAETARDTVAKNPLVAVAGAFFAGLVASALLRR